MRARRTPIDMVITPARYCECPNGSMGVAHAPVGGTSLDGGERWRKHAVFEQGGVGGVEVRGSDT